MDLPLILAPLDIAGWRPLLFALGDTGHLEEGDDLATALRIEHWIVSGDQYAFVERESVDAEWSAPEIGEWSLVEDGDAHACGDTIASLADLLPIVRRAVAAGSTVHPALLSLLTPAT